MRISILNSTKLRGKFCVRMNKTFGCKDAYMCNIACPLWLAFHVEYLMNEKNYSIGEAFRQTIREAIDMGDGRRIIRNHIKNKDKPYPPEGWRDKYE